MNKNNIDKCKEICSGCINTGCKCRPCLDVYPNQGCGGTCGLKISVSAFKRCREQAEEDKKK